MLTSGGSECERCTPPISLQRVDVDLVIGAWLQTCSVQHGTVRCTEVALERTTFPPIKLIFPRTCDGVGAQAGLNGSLNGYEACGKRSGRGLDQEAGDELSLGAPRQRDGGVVDVGDANAARRADVWGWTRA